MLHKKTTKISDQRIEEKLIGDKVKKPAELAKELAYRARFLMRLALKQLKEEAEDGFLRRLYHAFKEELVHDQTEEEFADAFAQTITYGLLTARWMGNEQLIADGEQFTRQTAFKHLQAASPFLNELFRSVLSVRLDEQRGRLLWLVDDITDLLDRINVSNIFGPGDADSDATTDPVIHFYEPFLAAYDNELRNRRGVYFTPRPVVSYIVRSVHELLQTEFGLEDGLASTDTWGDVAARIKGLKIPDGVKDTDPFVCILDPATGTGTFLYECIEVIERTMKDRWCRELKKKDWKDPVIVARWNDYVPQYLLPRLYGYELLVAFYAVAHLKLSFKLKGTGFRLQKINRLQVFLTNSLKAPFDEDQKNIFEIFPALSNEAKVVDTIKSNQRFTVVIGNPPYARDSANRSEFAESLTAIYKKDVSGERNIQPLSDDYIKFMGLSQAIITRSSIGCIGLITNHSFIHGVIHRGMRSQICQHFDRAYFLDLHGNLNIKEQAPTGIDVDENVFDIRQGVAISLLSRTPDSDDRLLEINVADLWGYRILKYEFLSKHSLKNTNWAHVELKEPNFSFFASDDESAQTEFDEFHALQDWFPFYATGFITQRDNFVIDFDRAPLLQRVQELANARISIAEIINRYELKDNQYWNPTKARNQLRTIKNLDERIIPCIYRPFDSRWCWWGRELMDRPRPELKSIFLEPNITLLCKRQNKKIPFSYAFVTSEITESCTFESAHAHNVAFPIFVLSEKSSSLKKERRPNIGNNIAICLRNQIGLELVSHKSGNLKSTCSPTNILNYIYSILYSKNYRTRYAQCLVRSFPRLPLTHSLDLFKSLALLGEELVALHLMESSKLKKVPSTFIGGQDSIIDKISWSERTVWIDKKKTTGFKNVPEDVWNFHIGGYQVCQKWLKDRKGRTLSEDDIKHYQKIVVALSETIRIMKEIDEVIEKHGGWPGAFISRTRIFK